MATVLLLGLVIGFTVVAPDIYRRRGRASLWLLVAGASVLAALIFAFLNDTGSGDNPAHPPLGALFFWPALVAAGTGFGLVALLIRRRASGSEVRRPWPDVALGLVVWFAGVVVGGLAAAFAGFLLLSAMAP